MSHTRRFYTCVFIVLGSLLIRAAAGQAQDPPMTQEEKDALYGHPDSQNDWTQCYGDAANLLYPFTGPDPQWIQTMPPNDDQSSDEIVLPFTFPLFGEAHTSCWINNNGNISFGGPVGTFNPVGFPAAGFPMVAAFWADVDTRRQDDEHGTGLVWHRFLDSNGDGSDDTLVVTWDNVGYYFRRLNKLNTFQIAISDGSNPLMGLGNTVCFSYDNMCWTTGMATPGNNLNGFGGDGATVGVNRGDGANYWQIGRFNAAGLAYDGPEGDPDGVDYLDGGRFCYNTGADLCPVAQGFPAGDEVTITAPASWDLVLSFVSPLPGAVVAVSVNDVNGAQAAGLLVNNVPGETATVTLSWDAECADQGDYRLEFAAVIEGGSSRCVTEAELVIHVVCPLPPTPGTADRVQYSHKADLFVWPYVVIRWDNRGTPQTADDVVSQDVFISVTNDSVTAKRLKMIFVDAGDCGGGPGTPCRSCFGVDAMLDLTGNNPAYFSAFSGAGGGVGGRNDGGVFPSFRGIQPLGYQDPAFPADPRRRILRGFIVGWTVDEENYPIGTNQLAGSATVIDYRLEEAWEYKPWAFRSNFTGRKSETTALRLNYDSDNYQQCPEMLLFHFWASGSQALGNSVNPPIGPSTFDFEISLVNMWLDFRATPDFDGDGVPGNSAIDAETATTSVQVLSWNEMEQPFSGTQRCLTCWDSTVAGSYGYMGAASPFALSTLGTDKGKARVWAMATPACSRVANPNSNPPIIGKPARSLPIVGLAHGTITWPPGPGDPPKARKALVSLLPVGMGTRADGVIYFDGNDQGDPPTLPEGKTLLSEPASLPLSNRP